MSVVSIFAIFADDEEARRISRQVVDERLAACANILPPVHSIYHWQGAVEEGPEVAAWFKTTDAQADQLIARIAGLHSYDVPCILSEPVDRVLGSYATWVEKTARV
jgi:periplasmic divalent cation tolerance protein